MSPSSMSFDSTELDQFVVQFEKALENGVRDIDAHLPKQDVPIYIEVLRELIRVDLEFGWENGSPLSLDDYRRRYPTFFEDQANVAAVAFEEYRLRLAAGDQPSRNEYLDRFGISTEVWPDSIKNEGAFPETCVVSPPSIRQVAEQFQSNRQEIIARNDPAQTAIEKALADLYRAAPELADRFTDQLCRFPEVGEAFLGFRLVAELGRGGFGCVFLAHQADLANRLVALKIAPEIDGESQTLAQLQHTHIVPIYSFHHTQSFQAVCMPYFGSITMADLLKLLQSRGKIPASGTELLTTVRNRSVLPARPSIGARPIDQVVQKHKEQAANAVWKKFKAWTYVEAVLWWGSCLADGLAHAHERGIIHRDLKPANVLITDEGHPMLLDFNLSQDVKAGDLAASVQMGGTLPYMAPEHLRAFQGEEDTVDARSDLFALGIILFEMLTGKSPYDWPTSNTPLPDTVSRMLHDRLQPAPSIRGLNRSVSPAVASILHKCLESDPTNRYTSARELHEDIQRQLDHRPLQYAREPSIVERVRKTLRRSPRLLLRSATVVAFLFLVLAVWYAWHFRQLDHKSKALENLAQFENELHGVHFILNTQDDPARQEAGRVLCKRSLGRYRVFAKSDWRAEPAFAYLSKSQQQSVEKEIASLLLMLARSQFRHGIENAAPQSFDKALASNQLAGSCWPSHKKSPVVLLQRVEILQAMGKTTEAHQFAEQAKTLPIRTAHEMYFRAGRWTTARKFHDALPLLKNAVRIDPKNYWARFLLGICHDGLGRDREAAEDYTVCIALKPEFFGAYFNRGLALLRQKDFRQAIADFDQVIQRKSELVHSYINRALAYQGVREYKKAVSDLTAALKLGAETRVYFIRARVFRRMGEIEAYRKDMAEGMKQTPTDEKSWIARGLARAAADPQGALADFDQALKLHPSSRQALNNKAYVYAKYLKSPEKAIAMLNRVILLYPDYVSARSGRGVLYGRQGMRELALQDAKRALTLDKRPPILYQVGCIYALTSKQKSDDRIIAMRLLADALRQGFGSDLLFRDDDLDPLRNSDDFRQLLVAAATLRKKR